MAAVPAPRFSASCSSTCGAVGRVGRRGGGVSRLVEWRAACLAKAGWPAAKRLDLMWVGGNTACSGPGSPPRAGRLCGRRPGAPAAGCPWAGTPSSGRRQRRSPFSLPRAQPVSASSSSTDVEGELCPQGLQCAIERSAAIPETRASMELMRARSRRPTAHFVRLGRTPTRAIKNAAQVTAMNTTRCCIHGFNQMGTMRGTQLELGAGAAGSTVAALVQLVLLAQRSRREGSWADTTRCCHSFKRACKLHSKSAASMLPPARLCCTASSASAGVPPPLAAAATAASCCWLAAKACVAACSAATASSNSACRLRVATAPSPAAGSGAGSGPPPEAHRHCAGRHAAGCRAALRSRTCHRGRTQA